MTESTMTATPAPAWDYVWFGGQPLTQIEVATGAVRTYFNDHLGTPILQTDAAGTVVWRIEHEPYGEDYAFRAGADLHQPLRLPGQEREVGNELAYNVFRWYRGGWGRYSQADPLGLGGGPNLYGYVSANPTRFVDPRGLVRWTCEYGYGTGELPGGGPGVGIFFANCVSDCVSGRRVSTAILSGVGGVSLGSLVPFTFSFSRQMELDDPFVKPDATNLEGLMALTSIGGAVGAGGSCTGLQLGSAFGWSCSGQVGVGSGWDSLIGSGAAFDTKTTCCRSGASGTW